MGKSLRVAYGESLVKLGAENKKVVVLDADLAHATQTCMFQEKYPDRFYNMGIAEANMMCAAAGFANTGYIPFASTFALFGAGRAYEQIRNSICYTNANVKFGFSHSGLSVGEDGGSHQSFEDIALMREMPHMTIFVPCDPAETEKAVMAAAEINGPVYIRVARPVCMDLTTPETPFIPGKANVMKEGDDVCIISCGLMIPEALKASEELEKEGIHAAVVNMHTIKPIDKDIILKMNETCKGIVTIEERAPCPDRKNPRSWPGTGVQNSLHWEYRINSANPESRKNFLKLMDSPPDTWQKPAEIYWINRRIKL